MTEDIIFEAQDYLTIENDGIKKRIVDLDSLIKRHSMDEIISFLKDYLGEKNRALKNLILIDKTQRRIDETVIAMFRIHMAIKLLEDGKEVKTFELSQQRARESRTFHKRYSRSHHRARSRKNGSNDEKNRPSRYRTQRAA
jgi:MFS superfamily sulfate permease-like transporter